MSIVNITVRLRFNGKINTERELDEIKSRVLEALERECYSGEGLSPDDSNAFIESIETLTQSVAL